jgi:uncharacterized protein YqeY
MMFPAMNMILFVCIVFISLVSSYKTVSISSPFRRMNIERLLPLSADAEGAVPTAPEVVGLIAQLKVDMKEAMKAKDKVKLSGVRMIQAAIKQKEIDERIVVTDDEAIVIMSKLIKQIKESIKSYGDASRQDLVDKEQAELDIVSSYMPAQLSAEEVGAMIDECITRLGATTIKDMGKVMADLKPKLMGKADTSEIGTLIKARLGGPK